jgi:hypothetical protein
LELLEADLGGIHAISTTVRQGDKEMAFSLAEHLLQLEQAIIKHQAALLVLDPILAFTGKRTDTYKSSEVRAVLAPLAAMADRTGCAILAVLHLNKRSGEMNSIYRITASLDFAAAARSVLVVGKHPEDPNCRVLAPVKTNLSAMPASLAFRFAQDGSFYWDGPVELDANAVLAPPAKDDPDEKSGLREAEHFLLTVLSEGWVECRQVLKEARDSGISERTLKRAKEDIGVVSQREGIEGKRGGGRWYWRLPEEDDLECQTPSVKTFGTLNRVGTLNQNGHKFNEISEQSGQKQIEFRNPMNEKIKDATGIKSANPHTEGAMAPLIPAEESDEAFLPASSSDNSGQSQHPWDTFLNEVEER